MNVPVCVGCAQASCIIRILIDFNSGLTGAIDGAIDGALVGGLMGAAFGNIAPNISVKLKKKPLPTKLLSAELKKTTSMFYKFNMIRIILLMTLVFSFIVLTTAQFGYNYGGYNGFGGGYGTGAVIGAIDGALIGAVDGALIGSMVGKK
ncbi:hypothetical protein ANCDUO_10984 [Ancylostoma duodenale]|uniref:Uncharacterized protein n=1 Tax=Ancylostoma duodenale TaxID=51022 RepID=A0A0C2D9C8_9BILA|nr:hypothetical protein ANCDUO_10984 [Ancylostoma duodenale]